MCLQCQAIISYQGHISKISGIGRQKLAPLSESRREDQKAEALIERHKRLAPLTHKLLTIIIALLFDSFTSSRAFYQLPSLLTASIPASDSFYQM